MTFTEFRKIAFSIGITCMVASALIALGVIWGIFPGGSSIPECSFLTLVLVMLDTGATLGAYRHLVGLDSEVENSFAQKTSRICRRISLGCVYIGSLAALAIIWGAFSREDIMEKTASTLFVCLLTVLVAEIAAKKIEALRAGRAIAYSQAEKFESTSGLMACFCGFVLIGVFLNGDHGPRARISEKSPVFANEDDQGAAGEWSPNNAKILCAIEQGESLRDVGEAIDQGANFHSRNPKTGNPFLKDVRLALEKEAQKKTRYPGLRDGYLEKIWAYIIEKSDSEMPPKIKDTRRTNS